MLREYYSVSEIRVQQAGSTALILQSPAGKILLLKTQDTAPDGKWCVIGRIDRGG